MRLPAFSRIWARCRFAHSCCRVLLAQARSWPDSSWSDGLVTGVVTLFSYPSACTATARPVPPLEKGRSSTLLDVTDRVRRFISLFAWAPCVLLQLDPRRFLVTVNVYVMCVFTPLHCDEPIMAARQVSVLPVAPPPLVHSKSTASSIDLIFSGAETMTFPKETLVRPELRIMQHNEAPAPPRFLFARELILFTR